jgi:flavorubredoxin
MQDIRTAEIADGIFQFTTHLTEVDFGVNQYLVTGDEPLLFHTGMRWMHTELAAAVSAIVPLETLRWVSFGHVEADECGALNQWLTAAPHASPTTGATGCMISVEDLADRAPRPLSDGEVIDIGGHRLRWIDTPHLPHNWEAGLLFDQTTSTLLCGDLFSRFGTYPAATPDSIVVPDEADDPAHSLTPSSAAQLRALAALEPGTLAPMHGPAQQGDGAGSLASLADLLERRLAIAEVT